MDHCSTCRRTLNGALVCAGCGAYAPDIDPWRAVAEARAAERAAQARKIAEWRDGAPEQQAEPDPAPAGAGRPGPARTDPAPADAEQAGAAGAARPEGAAGAPSGPAAGPGPAPAAEPAQDPDTASGPAPGRPTADPEADGADPGLPSARWHRSRRRAAAATALAFLGGSLTLGAVVADSPKGAASSSAPDPTATSAGTTSGAADPSGTGPTTDAGTTTPRHPATRRVPAYGPVVPGTRDTAPLRTSSSATGTAGGPSSPTASSTGGGTGTVSPTPSSTVPSASPTTTPKHRVCVLTLCFD